MMFSTILAVVIISLLPEIKAAGNDDCEFIFRSYCNCGGTKWLFFNLVTPPEVKITIYTKDGDAESTTEQLWCCNDIWSTDTNNEDIDGDYNLDRIEMNIFRYNIVTWDYIDIKCGEDLNPSGLAGHIQIKPPSIKEHMIIDAAALRCGDDQDCISKHIRG